MMIISRLHSNFKLSLFQMHILVAFAHVDWNHFMAKSRQRFSLTLAPLPQPSGSSSGWSTPSHSATEHYHVYQRAPIRSTLYSQLAYSEPYTWQSLRQFPCALCAHCQHSVTSDLCMCIPVFLCVWGCQCTSQWAACHLQSWMLPPGMRSGNLPCHNSHTVRPKHQFFQGSVVIIKGKIRDRQLD